MKSSSRRSRRNRSPKKQEKNKKPFFSKTNDTNVQTKEDSAFFQPKLAIGQPGDKYEQEADTMADAVVNKTNNAKGVQKKGGEDIQRVTLASPAEDEKLGTAEQRMEKDKLIQEKPEEEEVQKMEEEEAVQQVQEEEEPVQKMGEEEEESVQKVEEEEESVQKMGEEEEESVQKMDEEEESVQKMGEEEEEPVQKMDEEEEPVQKMGEEEEEAVQKMDEEEESVQKMGEEEEEPVQAKSSSSNNQSQASPEVTSKIQSEKGRGKTMPDQTRAEMENSFGVDFSDVNIHTDTEAIKLNKQLGAQAFATGKDIYFNSGKFRPETSAGKHLLAHELTHVVQQGGGKEKGIQKRDLTALEKKASITSARSRMDGASVRSIQRIVGLAGKDIDGVFGPVTAKAVSDWQGTKGLTDNGVIDEATMDQLITTLNTSQTRRHEAIHLVTDYYNMNTTSNTLTIYASRANVSATTFEAGLQVIEIGKLAFASTATLKLAIETELAKVDPNAIVGPIAPAAEILTQQQRNSAMSYMKWKYKDPRSIMVLQNQLGMMSTGTVDKDFVQRIAKAQQDDGNLKVDGKVGRNTLEHFFTQLRDGGNQNAAIRLILDFYRISDHGNVTAIYYDGDPAYTGYAATSRNPRGPVRVRIRRALYQPFEAMVHSINHEFEHVRQHKVGILSADTREFLGESTEIISRGMQDETLFNVKVADGSGTGLDNTSGLYDDAGRCIKRWNAMPLADRKKYWYKFVTVRRILRARVAGTFYRTKKQDRADWAAATPAAKLRWTNRIAAYNAINKPA